ncbi:glycoside hydrolase family 43 protein [Paenibacillus sp. DCT19]|uniref:glycoside hydrolase family 43 protein n=1 Tax=Paenibacillus sp. DCT19 TaxID=2211212 RepID=UPI000FE210EB|nr:glycoside hydrolase family 43 protein [Paenibacillus sp. DCT19]
MRKFQNPVLPGFYPDPSAIRVGEDYYLVTSSFEYFPGVPLFHSKDLVNWRQLGHILDRPSQLNLDHIAPSMGIWAPTIRYHNGIFYMITTYVDNEKQQHNFYVTATDPAGDWSDPVWLEDAPGIDPSLFFDDGRVYYTGNRVPPGGQEYPKHMDIWLQEIDLSQGRLVGEKCSIWQGALKVAHAQEGAHLYKIGKWYYVTVAEGGTGHTHAVTIARSRNVKGPYEGHKANPILTHRHLGREFPIVNVGHGELVETQHGEWWMFCLASRTAGGYYRNLGRETFLAPVIWENEWPVVSPGKGMLEFETVAPNLPEHTWEIPSVREDFDVAELSPVWNFLRTPRGEFWSLTEHPGYLRLKLKPEQLIEQGNPSFIGRRQQHLSFIAAVSLIFEPQANGEVAGLVLLHNANFHFRFVLSREGDRYILRLIERFEGEEKELGSNRCDGGRVQLKVEARHQDYSFYFRTEETDEWKTLCTNVDGRLLSTDLAGGFTGTYIGLYASSQGAPSTTFADFDWFDYEGLN